jgi:hypothetical protein
MIYLARRNPALTREEFAKRWRKHATVVDINSELVRLRRDVAEWLSPRTGVVLSTEIIFSWPQAGE